jgi:hypothetical protein
MADATPTTPAAIAAAQAKEAAAIEKDLAENPRDETDVPGGRYKRAGSDAWFNAEGQEITKDGKVKKTDE